MECVENEFHVWEIFSIFQGLGEFKWIAKVDDLTDNESKEGAELGTNTLKMDIISTTSL